MTKNEKKHSGPAEEERPHAPYPLPTTDYGRAKREHQDAHRRRVFERDGWRCRLCSRGSRVELAHVTRAIDFYNQDHAFGLERSYRDDNFVTLCMYHHAAHDNPESVPEPLELRMLRRERWCHILGDSAPALVDQFSKAIAMLEEKDRSDVARAGAEVAALFDQIVAKRGWRTCEDLARFQRDIDRDGDGAAAA